MQYCFESENLILNRNTESTELAESTAGEHLSSVLFRIGLRSLFHTLLHKIVKSFLTDARNDFVFKGVCSFLGLGHFWTTEQVPPLKS